MMNRRFLLVLTVSFLFLPFTTTWVKNENASAYENPADVTNYTTEAFTEKFKGTIPALAFVGPDNAFEIVNASIHAATTSLYLEVYTLSSQNLIDSLIYANTTNGVDVIVLLEFDHVSVYEDNYTAQAAYDLDNAGVEVLWTTPDYTFTHAKFWVIDAHLTYVYSGNWAPSSLPADTDARTNREMGLMFDETEIAAFYEGIFFEDYAKATAYSGTDPGHTLPSEDSGTYVPAKVNPLSINEYMEVIPVFSPNNSYAMLLSLIENATTTIDVQQQYMTHTCALTYDLIDAANSGVDVRVMIPEPDSASKNVTEILLQNGIDVRFSYSLYNHNKFLLVDGEYVSVSSINWSNGSVVDNREAGAIVKNTNIAAYLGDVFEWDWENYTHIPTGFTPEVEITKPVQNTVADGTIEVEAGFYIGPFTSGTLYIDNSLVHTWATPDGLETYSLDTTTYADGIHQVKVIGTPSVGDPVIDEHDINIVNLAWWRLLISEVRFDAVSEPGGEFFELYNGFSFDVAIGGWEVTDGEAIYTIPADTVFTADDCLIFVRDSTVYTTEMTALGITSPLYDFVYTDLLLANSGDELILSGPHGDVDAVVWGSGSYPGVTSWTGSIDDTQSLQRNPANQDTDDCSVDFIVGTPNPGASIPEVEIITPVLNTVVDDTIEVQADFYIGPFTTGTLFIDNSLVHTWTTPDGLETYSLDTTAYVDGIHQIKIIGTPTVGDPIIVEHDFNIVNLEWWGILISEVRFDAVTETDGEFFELYNDFSFDVAIGGWTVSNNLATYTIPADTVFLADDILVFVRDSAVYTTEMNALGITSPVFDYVYDSLILVNAGDILVLDGPHGNVDAVVWGTGTYTGVTAWTGTIDDTESLQRDPANQDTDDCSVDFIVRIPNPGTVYVSETPSGFIPGFIFSTTLFAIAVVTLVIVFSKRKK